MRIGAIERNFLHQRKEKNRIDLLSNYVLLRLVASGIAAKYRSKPMDFGRKCLWVMGYGLQPPNQLGG